MIATRQPEKLQELVTVVCGQKHPTEGEIKAAIVALRSVDDEKQKISPCYKHGASIVDADMLCGLKSAQRQNQHRICVIPITPSGGGHLSNHSVVHTSNPSEG